MTEMYGDRFCREYGSVPNDTWTATIARMADTDIAAALKALAEKGSPHPPTLGEFVKAGKAETGSPRYLGANPVSYTEQRVKGLLPQPPKAVRDMSALRAALRGGK